MGSKKRETIAGLSGVAVGSVAATLLHRAARKSLAQQVNALQAQLAQAQANRHGFDATQAQAQANRQGFEQQVSALQAQLAQVQRARQSNKRRYARAQAPESRKREIEQAAYIQKLEASMQELKQHLVVLNEQWHAACPSAPLSPENRNIAQQRRDRSQRREGDVSPEHLEAVRAQYRPANQAGLANQMAAAQRLYADEKKRTRQLDDNLTAARAQLEPFNFLVRSLKLPAVLKSALDFHTLRQGVVTEMHNVTHDGFPRLVVDGQPQDYELSVDELGDHYARRMKTSLYDTGPWFFVPVAPDGDLNKAILQWLSVLVKLVLHGKTSELRQSLDSNQFRIYCFLPSTGQLDSDHICFGAPTDSQDVDLYATFVNQITSL